MVASVGWASGAAQAADTKADATVSVASACSLTASGNLHQATLTPGTVGEVGEASVFNIFCNGNNLYQVYAVGYSNDSEGNTSLIGTSGNNIATGLATSGEQSGWAFKLASEAAELKVEAGYSDYALVPGASTLVAKRESNTGTVTNDVLKANYRAFVSKSQAAGSYTGKVKYTLFDQGLAVPPTMQDFECDLGNGATTTLTDARDGHSYKVAKLADGKCWMTENLRLGDSQLKNRTLTTADSDVGKNVTLPNSSTSGFNNYNTHYLYVPESASGNYKMEYGGYYSWYTATAEEGTQSKSSGNVSHSICPKGWRLPTQFEFSTLYSSYGSNSSGQLLKDPANFVLSGNYYSSSPYSQGSYGYYWSSSAGSTNNAYYLGLNSSGGYPSNNDGKYRGFTVRCVAR